MTKATRNIEDILSDIKIATEAYKDAVDKESVARSHATNCRNKLNNLQKEFDAATKEFRNGAPRDTDWTSKRYMVDE